MAVSQNISLCKLTNRIKLNLLIFGNATVDSGWHGKVTSPPFSRLYYITKGEFSITGNSGEKYILSPGKWHLIPSGYSFSYECQEEMSHFYFHLKVCDLDGADLLSGCDKPMNIETSDFDNDFFLRSISENGFCQGVKLRNIMILSTSNVSVSELSNRLGFSDQFYFSRKFKEKFGISPRTYRKNKLL